MPQNKLKKDNVTDGNQLPGWPGYRTRSNRSGLDPLDTRAEAAHMEGTLLRNIFTLRARTRNSFYLLLMFVFGVIPFVILLALMIGGMPGFESSSIPSMIIYLLLPVLVTGAVTINFLLSILEITGIITSRKPVGQQRKGPKKKQPKRRKDFR